MTPRDVLKSSLGAAAADEALAALAFAGYAIVPHEPTEAMNIAAVEKLCEINSEIAKRLPDEPVNPRTLLPLVSSKQTAPVWRAMIDAAAKP